MANIIAVIWDFDKTLIDGYMQDVRVRRNQPLRVHRKQPILVH